LNKDRVPNQYRPEGYESRPEVGGHVDQDSQQYFAGYHAAPPSDPIRDNPLTGEFIGHNTHNATRTEIGTGIKRTAKGILD
jgi:hypothetical protein